MTDLNINREKMEYDLVIVGAGPAGLSAAINFKKLCQSKGKNFSVCVVEKGSEVGAHILSGAILQPTALDELIEDWRSDNSCPVKTSVKSEELKFLSESKSYNIPKLFIPKVMHNDGNFIISLGSLCKWLATKAEAMGIEIYPGFAASEIILSEGKLAGVITSDLGLDKDGKPSSNFQPGIEILSLIHI